LPEEMFGTYKNRGKERRYRRCKDCLAKYKHEHYEKNKQKYLDRWKQWRVDNHDRYIEYLHDYYWKNRDQLLEKAKKYYTSDTGRELNKLRSRKYRASREGKMKERARKAVHHALLRGELIRPDCCELCGKQVFVEAHHDDYNKPLEVRWLCKQCHENIHHLNGGHVSWTVTALKPSDEKDA
jgi:hypothetical protein